MLQEAGGPMAISETAKKLATAYAIARDCDVILYSGEIDDEPADNFISACQSIIRRRKNVLLILATPGGSAEAAYRMARILQGSYSGGTFTVFVNGWCKSAGTLLVVGAHAIIMGDLGELGPLDVQLGKQDELFEYSSGLIIDSALDALERRAMRMFENYFMQIKAKSGNRITFKTATQIASNMVVNLLAPVYEQIDPIKIGENAREMSVASDYGARLDAHSRNLKSRRALSTLVESYSSHRFVIDRSEASVLFERVGKPDEELTLLAEELGDWALVPSEKPVCELLSTQGDEDGEQSDEEKNTSAAAVEKCDADAAIIRADFGGTVAKDSASIAER